MKNKINNYMNFKLKDIICVETLQMMQDKFAEATDLAAVIVNHKGYPVTQYSNCTRYCQTIHSTPLGRKSCAECGVDLGIRALQSPQKIAWHICYGGLVKVSAPVIVNGIYIGQVMCGQVLFEEYQEEVFENAKNISRELELDYDLLVQYLKEIKVISQKQLLDSAELLTIISNYIVGSGMNAIAQEELHQKEIQLMEITSSRIQLNKTLKELELKTLQSQVNPHFLFNALNTIARLAMFENADCTQDMTYNLAQLLRYSLRQIDKPAMLGEEIGYIKNYLTIQATRFGERIKYNLNIKPEVMDFYLPTMTIQPLVENSIIHGLEPKPEGGQIRISAKKEEQWVVIQITDTGMGLSQDQIEKIFRGELQGTGQGHSTCIGILNVYKRLMHYYNNKCKVKMESRKGHWTKITLRLPYYWNADRD